MAIGFQFLYVFLWSYATSIQHNSWKLDCHNHVYYLQAQIYKEDFELERHDREVAHGMYADLQRKYAYEMGKLEEHHKEKLAEVEHVHQGREKEMRGVLEEALKKKKNQQELQAKTSQLKLYKKQVDSQRDQVCLHYLCVTWHICVFACIAYFCTFSLFLSAVWTGRSQQRTVEREGQAL